MAKPKANHVTKVDDSPEKEWDTGTVLLGTGLIVAGIIFLLGSLDVIDVHLENIWQLWPLAVIALGISFLKLTGVWRLVVTGIFIIASLGLLVVTLTRQDGAFSWGQSNNHGKESRVSIDRQNDSIERLSLTVNTGAMKMNIASQNGRQLATATLDASERFSLNQSSTTTGSTQEATITTKGSGFGIINLRNANLSVRVAKDIPLHLRIDAGASLLDADLADLRLQEFMIDTGASKVNAKLGNKEDTTKVSIDAGASSITLLVPKDSGVRVEHDGGLTGTDFQDIPKVKDGLYESTNFNSAVKKIVIVSDAGASSIKIERY